MSNELNELARQYLLLGDELGQAVKAHEEASRAYRVAEADLRERFFIAGGRMGDAIVVDGFVLLVRNDTIALGREIK